MTSKKNEAIRNLIRILSDELDPEPRTKTLVVELWDGSVLVEMTSAVFEEYDEPQGFWSADMKHLAGFARCFWVSKQLSFTMKETYYGARWRLLITDPASDLKALVHVDTYNSYQIQEGDEFYVVDIEAPAFGGLSDER